MRAPLIVVAFLAALAAFFSVMSLARAPASVASGPVYEHGFYLKTPHGLCLWVKRLVSGSQLTEVPCRLQYAWTEEIWTWGHELTPAGSHGRLAAGNVNGHLYLTSANSRRAVSLFSYGKFSYRGIRWVVIRFAHQPEFPYERGRGRVVTLVTRPSVPWSGFYFQDAGGTLT